MATNHSSEYNQAIERLMTTIKLLKLRLEAKYGPTIKDKWEHRERFTN